MNQNQAFASAHSASTPPPRTFRDQERLKPTSKRQPGQARLHQPGEPRREYFKSGFTVTANCYLDKCGYSLNKPQERTFKWVQRFSTGYCHEWFRVNSRLALEWTGLTRSSFYRARKDLQAIGLIELKDDRYGVTWGRLHPDIQPLKPEYIATLDPPPFEPNRPGEWDDSSHSPGHTVPPAGTAPNTCMKENLEKITDHRQQQPQTNPGAVSEEKSALVVATGVTTEESNKFWSKWWTSTPQPAEPAATVDDQHDEPVACVTQPEPPALTATLTEQPADCELEKVPPEPPAPELASKAAKLQQQADRRAETIAKATRRAERTAKKAAEAPLIKTKSPGQPELTADQLANAEALRACGVAVPKDERLVRTKSSAAIARALAELRIQKEVFNPGGWLFHGLTSGRFDEEPSAAPEESEADRVRRAEAAERRKFSQPEQNISGSQREALLQAVRDREAARARADQERLDADTDREMATLNALSREERAALYERARASMGARQLPPGVIKGTMLAMLEADQRALARASN